jgi:hypothetical protein
MKILRKHNSLDEVKKDKWHTKLIEELGDVYCMMDLLVEHNLVDEEELYKQAQSKRAKLAVWSDLVKDTPELKQIRGGEK